MSPLRSVPVFAGSAWLLAAAGLCQVPAPAGNVYGTALDTLGRPLDRVIVTLTGPGATQTSSTDERGDFHFLNLSPGAYSVALEKAGFERIRKDIAVALGNAVVSVTLPVAGVAEEVVVESGATSLDTREVQTGSTFGRRELEAIPTARDPWAILRQVPGVLFDVVDLGGNPAAHQTSYVGKGSHSGQNTYNLDGAALSVGGVTPMFFDFDSLDTIEVTTGGSNLAVATPGVTLNLVTRRGTNELRGSARGLYTGGAGWDYGVETGGPLWRDRVWLWAAFARDDYLTQSLTNFAGEPLAAQDRLRHWNAKLNAQPVPSNALTLAYTDFDRTFVGYQSPPNRSAQSIWTNFHPGQSYKVEDSQVVSPNLFASAYFSYVPATGIALAAGGSGEQADEDSGGIWRHSYLTVSGRDDKHQAGGNASVFFATGGLRHEARIGLGYLHVRFDSIREWPGDQLVGHLARDPSDPDPGLADITRRQNAKSEVNVYDVFASDTIQLGNLTVTAGGRFDYQQGRNIASTTPASPVFPELLPAVSYPGDPGYPITWREFQPRASATYALDSSRTLLRASYARFTDQLDSTTVFAVNAFPAVASLTYVWNDVNGDGRVQASEVDLSDIGFRGSDGIDRANPGSITPVNQISPDLKAPVTDEIIVGVERQITSELTGSVAFTHRTRRDMLFAPLIGTARASYQYLGNASGIAVDGGFALSFDEPYYGLTECAGCPGTILRNRPDTSETYDGVEIQLVKSFSHGWMARVSFAWNDWRQRVGVGGIVDPNNETPGTNATGPYVVNGVINARWQFNVSGTVQLPLGIAAGMNLYGREGFPAIYSVLVLTGDANLSDPNIQIGGSTAYRTPKVFVADLQLSKTFQVGPDLTITPMVDCFNLLNSHTVLARGGAVGLVDTNAEGVPTFEPYDRFNAPHERLGGTVYRGGVRIAF